MTRARDLANLIGSGNFTTETLTATAGQTAFTPSNTFTSNFLQVFYNGLLLDPTVDYTENGTTITLTVPATAGDEMEVVTYNTFSVGDAITQTEADNRYVNASGDTMTGNLTTTGNIKATNGLFAGANNTYLYEGASNTLNIRIGETGPYAEFVDTGSGVLKIGNAGGRLSLSSNGVERINLDDAGRVTLPYQPAFHAQLNDVNYTASGQIQPIYNYASLNRGNHYNASTGVFTAPVNGLYHITQALATEATSSAGFFVVEMLVNGAIDYTRFSASSVNSGISEGGICASATIYLNANDTLKPIIYTSVTISIGRTTGGANTWWAGRNFFSGYLIG